MAILARVNGTEIKSPALRKGTMSPLAITMLCNFEVVPNEITVKFAIAIFSTRLYPTDVVYASRVG